MVVAAAVMYSTKRKERGDGRGHGKETGNERNTAGPPTTMRSSSRQQEMEGRKRAKEKTQGQEKQAEIKAGRREG